MSDSAFDHEREALAWLRRELKDQDPNRGWSNFEFASRNGSLYEVDALVLTAAGLFLVEVKSHPGEISGDGGTWQWAPPNRGRLQTFDNPRLLANRKAKHLADLLGRTGAWRAYRHAHPAARAPYVQEAVFLSDPDLRITLSPPGRFQVFGRDAAPGEELPAARRSIGGIVASLTSLEPDRNGRPARRIDRPMGEAIAKAVAELGIRERTSRKRVGDYRLGELLDDVEADRDTGITYQDFTATHVSLPDVRRRIRIYPVEHNPTADQRETADRAARREFTLLHALDYPGILRPVEFTESERGPALMFDYDPDERPLHRWLADPAVAERLTVEGRLAVIRMIAEAVRYAHQRGVTHRALCPSAVLVRGDLDDVRIRVTNWHAGARIAYGSGTGAGATSSLATVHGEALARHDAALYRAPEADQPAARAVLLDVFSLGALACLVLTGQPPAETPTGLVRMLVQHGHIPADVIDDELDPGLAGVVADATAADPAGRLPDVTEFLGYLDIAEEEWNLADMPAVSEPAPDDARRGDTLGNGRFTVQHRLGSGSTAIALEVDDNVTGRTAVLKVALDPQHNERLRTEGRALQELRHQAIVELHDGPIEIDGLVALVLSHAGRNTLAARVAEPPGAELAERFGDDLLDAVRYLEQMGVSHRDIKPENIGVAPRGKNDELHLVLFDFSLADAPLDRIEAGTAGYVDPFLKLPGRGAWDLHAERYAAAVTLYELVTGTRPRYGNDGADPAMTTAGPTIDRAAFDPAIANGLTGFFTRALARNIADRFDTADEMLQAWRRAFAAAAQPATPTVHPEPAAGPGDASPGDAGDVPARLVLPAGVTATTPLMSLPLSNRAVNALERQEVLTVGDLLTFPLSRVPRLAGVGPKTRREIIDAVAQLRDAVDNPAPEADPAFMELVATTLTERSAALLPSTTRRDQATLVAVARGLLGVDEPMGSRWPTQAELAAQCGVTAARVSQLIATLKPRWVKLADVTEVADWARRELRTAGGVAASVQLAQRLAAVQPDPATPVESHQRAARALLRAALLVEDLAPQPRWVLRRQGDAMMAALTAAGLAPDPFEVAPPGQRPDEPNVDVDVDIDLEPPIVEPAPADGTGQGLADYAAALTEAAEALVSERGVVPRWALLDALHQVPRPDAAPPLDDARLVDLVTGLSTTASVNARLELYQSGLAARDALHHARRAFITAAGWSPQDLADKVRTRYPDAEPLPTDPNLLRALLAECGIELRWDPTNGTFSAPQATDTSTNRGTTFSRRATGLASGGFTPIELDEAADFEARLLGARDHGGLLVLTTEPKHLPRAAAELDRLAAATVDLDDRLLERITTLTAAGRPSWELVVAADAGGPTGKNWLALTKVIDRAFDELTDDLFTTSGTVVVHNLGLLARYDRMEQVARWRDRLHSGDGHLGALWLLVGSTGGAERPTIDRRAVPVLSGNEWARIPDSWLKNTHRAVASKGPTP